MTPDEEQEELLRQWLLKHHPWRVDSTARRALIGEIGLRLASHPDVVRAVQATASRAERKQRDVERREARKAAWRRWYWKNREAEIARVRAWQRANSTAALRMALLSEKAAHNQPIPRKDE